MKIVQRHELKYFISSCDADVLSGKLEHILSPDLHEVNEDGYRIKSLYFDTLQKGALYDKQAGFIQRRKYRLRIYSEDDQHAKLEIKYKNNQQIRKISLGVTRKVAEELVAGNVQNLQDGSPLSDEFRAKLISGGYRPTVIVEYWRKAFIYPAFNVRITIDRFLHGNYSHLDLFSKSDAAFPVLMQGRQILEVKFDHYLPGYIRRLIQSFPLERAAISKYTLALRHMKKSQWEDN